MKDTQKVRAWRICGGISKTLENYKVWDVTVCTRVHQYGERREKQALPLKSHTLHCHWIEKSVISCVCIMNLNLEAISPCKRFHALLLIQKIPRSQQRKNMEIESWNSTFHLVSIYLHDLEQVPRTQVFQPEETEATIWTLQALEVTVKTHQQTNLH